MKLCKTVIRIGYVLGLYLVLAQSAFAQTTLNFGKVTFNERSNAGFTITNPTPNYADAQFTLYGLDGNPIALGLVNPVRYRIAPKGQISMRGTELFGASRADGWVQVTSTTSGLTGFYVSGDFATNLEGADSASAFSDQIVPVIRDDASNKTELVIVNPAAASGTVSVNLFNARGEPAGTIPSQSIAGHGSLRLSAGTLNAAGAGTLAARVSASVPVGATAVIDRGDSLLFVAGQPFDQPATLRIAPHFVTRNGFDPVVVLANPAGSPVSVSLTVFTEAGSTPFPTSLFARSFTIPANGSISADIRTITGQSIASGVNGWLRVESPNVSLAGVVILDQTQAVTSIPLQTAPLDRMIFPQVSETQALFTAVSLVNTALAIATVDVALVRDDGTTLTQRSLTIAGNSKVTGLVRDLVPEASGQSGYIVLRSSIPLHGVALLGALDNSFIASMSPVSLPDSFVPNAVAPVPVISRVEPGTDIQTGRTLRVSLLNAPANPSFVIAGQAMTSRPSGPTGLVYDVAVQGIETGFANLTVRDNGFESPPVALRIAGPDNVPIQTISGQAFYQKIDVTDAGLDMNHPVMVPIRDARVEVFSRSLQSIVAVAETDLRGRFSVPVPFDPNLTVRVMSRVRSSDLRVADNTNQGQLYALTMDIDGREARQGLVLADRGRMSGAFNILEIVQRANDLMKTADPLIALPVVTVFWNQRNRKGNGTINYGQGLIGTTSFNLANNIAYVLGDRSDDSDEFDDAVIAHEYAHLLAAKFSRDDSPGGPHVLGDMLDPRVAWSEGWADFFSAVVRNDPIWRDSDGPNGVNLIRYDLEDNVPAGDHPGYWSEASVYTILWDIFDDHQDPGDDIRYSFGDIWQAFTDLRQDRFVYLPYFLESFVARNPQAADSVRMIVQSRSIDFQPNVQPSVAYPFPTPMSVGSSVTGTVDSLTRRRPNLVSSSHFYSFTTTAGAASIRLDITGTGPGGNPNANDLDLFLMDSNGRIIDKSDTGLNGQSERIAVQLPAGTYVVVIRSFYTRAETGGFVFNSGQYRLSVTVQ